MAVSALAGDGCGGPGRQGTGRMPVVRASILSGVGDITTWLPAAPPPRSPPPAGSQQASSPVSMLVLPCGGNTDHSRHADRKRSRPGYADPRTVANPLTSSPADRIGIIRETREKWLRRGRPPVAQLQASELAPLGVGGEDGEPVPVDVSEPHAPGGTDVEVPGQSGRVR